MNDKGTCMRLKLTYWSLTLLLFFFLGLAFERPAHAYTDPGSALLVFQSLGAVASGVLFYFRRNIKRLFSRSSSPAAKPVTSAPVMSRVDS